ncbi:MAG: T9SS type A sorting domain-containing protein, partial [Bacteroidales bacterium]
RHDVAIPYSSYYYNQTNSINQIFHVNSLTGGTSYSPTPYNFGNLPMPVDTVVIAKPATGFETFVFTAPSAPYADFEIVASISPFSVNEAIRSNDTVRFYQKFYNYYAYDDGTPEAGYGLSSSNPNARLSLALRFDLNVPDTLRAVQMFFNQTKDLANQDDFILTVWQSVAGEPGDTLYTEEDLEPVFVNGVNQYHTYELTRPIPVSGSFYVGWQQKSGTMLNLGYDRNQDSRDYVRFNIGSGWNTSQFRGALMIRPVLGASAAAWISVPEKTAQRTFRLFPNPASSRINIEENTDADQHVDRQYRVLVFNATGQCVLQQTTSGTTDVSALTNGLYLVRILDHRSGQQLHSDKIIIRR